VSYARQFSSFGSTSRQPDLSPTQKTRHPQPIEIVGTLSLILPCRIRHSNHSDRFRNPQTPQPTTYNRSIHYLCMNTNPSANVRSRRVQFGWGAEPCLLSRRRSVLLDAAKMCSMWKKYTSAECRERTSCVVAVPWALRGFVFRFNKFQDGVRRDSDSSET
jgi:hypothetical protein